MIFSGKPTHHNGWGSAQSTGNGKGLK